MAQFMLKKIQHGLESSAGTGVPATWLHHGDGTLHFDEAVITPDYAAGIAGGVIEDSFIADTGATLTLTDTDLSAEAFTYFLQAAVQTQLTGATADFTRTFTFPSTAANSVSTYTWELATASQEYEFTYGVPQSFSVHGDVNADNGRIMYSAVIKGRAATASTVTSSLTKIANLHFLNANYVSVHLDAVGTAAGTASASAGVFRSFSLDVETGQELRRYMDGRSSKDPSVGIFTDYNITGNIKLDLSSAAVTRIANARAGTPEILALKCNGASSRLVQFNLPVTWTNVSELGENDGGIIPVTLDIRARYSRTSTAQAPSIKTAITTELTIT